MKNYVSFLDTDVFLSFSKMLSKVIICSVYNNDNAKQGITQTARYKYKTYNNTQISFVDLLIVLTKERCDFRIEFEAYVATWFFILFYRFRQTKFAIARVKLFSHTANDHERPGSLSI